MKVFVTCSLVMFVLLFLCPFAQAEEGDWEFDLVPLYFWGVNVDGTVGIMEQEAPVSVGFDDALEKLNAAFTIHFEGRKDSWGFFTDFLYVNLDNDTELPEFTLNTELENMLIELGGYYTIGDNPNLLDMMFGARITVMDTKLTYKGGGPSASQSLDWANAIWGLRYRGTLSDNWTVVLRGDFGFFLVGSEYTWNLSALTVYHPWEHVGITFGWRGYKDKYVNDDEAFSYEAHWKGPVVGLDIMW